MSVLKVMRNHLLTKKCLLYHGAYFKTPGLQGRNNLTCFISVSLSENISFYLCNGRKWECRIWTWPRRAVYWSWWLHCSRSQRWLWHVPLDQIHEEQTYSKRHLYILCFFIQPKSNTILLQCRTSSVSYIAMMIHKTWERLHFLDLVMIQIMEVLFRQMLESILQFHLHLHLLLCLSGDDGYWWEARVEGLSRHAWSEAATRVPLRGLVGHWRFIRLGTVKCSFHSILVQQIFKSYLNQGLKG